MTDPLLVPVREAARRLSLGRDTTYRLVGEGRLPSLSVGRRRLVPVTSLARFIEAELARAEAEDRRNGSSEDGEP
jgi:excisionase family DNA binding protein